MPQLMNNTDNQSQNDILRSLGQATIQQLTKIGATPQDSIGDSNKAIMQALIAGTTKGLQKSAEEATMQGGPEMAQHILSKYVTPLQQPDINQPMSFSANDSQSNQDNQSNFSVSGGQPTIQDMQGKVQQNILQQLISTTKQPEGVLAGFLHGFAQGTGYTKGNLENLNSAATAAGLVQEQAGQKPIQPTDVAKMNRETFANTVTGYKSQLENNQKQYNELNQQLKTLEENRNPIEKGLGLMSKDQLAIIDQMKAIQMQNIEHLNGLKEIMVNAPKQLAENTNQSKFKVKKIGN